MCQQKLKHLEWKLIKGHRSLHLPSPLSIAEYVTAPCVYQDIKPESLFFL